MGKYISRRLLWIIPELLLIVLVLLFLMGSIKGSPWQRVGKRAMSSVTLDEVTKRYLDKKYGLDRSFFEQYFFYVIGREVDGRFNCGLICGYMGPSLAMRGQDVADVIFGAPEGRPFFESRFFYSMRLGGYAFLLALFVGINLGVLSAQRHNRWLDKLIRFFSTLAISVPNFIVGLMMIMLMGTQLHLIQIAPVTWRDASILQWFSPVFVLSLGTMGNVIRLVRSSYLDVKDQDFVRYAHAKGLHKRLISRVHILRNSLIPLVTYSGPALIELITGGIVIEMMFSYPGLSRTFFTSIFNRDYPLILGLVLSYALMIILSNLMVDIVNGIIDPRLHVTEFLEVG